MSYTVRAVAFQDRNFTTDAQRLRYWANTVLAATHGTFTSDGSDYWIAAPDYSNPFIPDTYYAMRGYADYFQPKQIKAWADKIVAKKDGSGNFPCYLSASDESAQFYSGLDDQHNKPQLDPAMLIPLTYKLHYDLTMDISAFNAVSASLKTAINLVPLDGTTKLVTINNALPFEIWGFHDGSQNTGNDLMASLLYYEACTALAAMFTAAGSSSDATTYSGRATDIVNNLDAALWNAGAGMYNSATTQNAQIDVLGSAYAVYLGIPNSTKSTSISDYINTNYSSLVKAGFVRQSNADWANSWPLNTFTSGQYDHGHWAVAHEWVATALAYAHSSKATQFIRDFAGGGFPLTEWLAVSNSVKGVANNLVTPMGALKYAREHGL